MRVPPRLFLERRHARVDAFGTIAFWNPVERAVQAAGGSSISGDPITLFVMPPNTRVADMAMGFDDVLYVAVQETNDNGSVLRTAIGMFDPRGRWRQPRVFALPLDNFTPNRLAADPHGGAWLLDRTSRRIGRVRGLPLRDGLPPDFAATTFRPEPENPDGAKVRPRSAPAAMECPGRAARRACMQS